MDDANTESERLVSGEFGFDGARDQLPTMRWGCALLSLFIIRMVWAGR